MSKRTPKSTTRDNLIVIELTRGKSTIIDIKHADLAARLWHTLPKTNVGFYAVHKNWPEDRLVYLHRVILERMLGRPLMKGEVVDHINGDGLDNRESNLRLANIIQNSQNAHLSKANKTGFKGVTFRRNRYRATIRANGKDIELGLFRTAEDAGEAYRKAAALYFGDFARS